MTTYILTEACDIWPTEKKFDMWVPVGENSQYFGKNHRLVIHEEQEGDVIFGFDPIYYGDTTNKRVGNQRFILSKKEFAERTVTMKEFNLRWLKSLYDDAH